MKEVKQPTIFIDCEDMEERYGTQLYIEYLEKYKKCWDELMNLYRITFKDTMSKNDYAVLHRLEELEKKYLRYKEQI